MTLVFLASLESWLNDQIRPPQAVILMTLGLLFTVLALRRLMKKNKKQNPLG